MMTYVLLLILIVNIEFIICSAKTIGDGLNTKNVVPITRDASRDKDQMQINASLAKNQIWKCCLNGEYIVKAKKCEKVKVNNYENPHFSDVPLYDTYYVTKTGKSVKDVYDLVPGKFNKISKKTHLDYTKLSTRKHNYYLTEEGILYEETPNTLYRWQKHSNHWFCIEYYWRKGDPKPLQYSFWSVHDELEDTTDSNLRDALFVAGFSVSSVFLVLVLVAYSLLPDLRNLSGMVLMTYVASLLGAFLSLIAIRKFASAPESCYILTSTIYFFLLASFCWTNVMSLDIWWTFRGYAKARPIHRRGILIKYLIYCAYAFGVPLIMTVGLVVLNQLDMSHIPWFITPDIGQSETNCFFKDGPKLIYLYIPMLILILCNWAFFLMTAFNVWRLHRSTAMLDTAAAGTPAAHRSQRHRFMLYLKLSIVMGISWLLEVMTFFQPNLQLWYISDAYNVLIGMSIFFIFVCKRSVYAKLTKRYGVIFKRPRRGKHKSNFSNTSGSDLSADSRLQVSLKAGRTEHVMTD